MEEEVNRNGDPAIKVHAVADRPMAEHVLSLAFNRRPPPGRAMITM